MRTIKKNLRSVQQQRRAVERRDLMTGIQDAHSHDQKTFFKLVNRQRTQSSAATRELVYRDQTYTDDEGIRIGWANYFEDLATPHFDPKYDDDHLQFVTSILDALIRQSTPHGANLSPVDRFSEVEVSLALRQLKKGKAADIHGITSEHLLNAQDALIPYITELFNSMLSTGTVPSAFKTGLLIPLLKKANKPKQLPTNYRGITVISTIGKLLELCLSGRIRSLFNRAQSGMQRGFTEKIAPIYADRYVGYRGHPRVL